MHGHKLALNVILAVVAKGYEVHDKIDLSTERKYKLIGTTYTDAQIEFFIEEARM